MPLLFRIILNKSIFGPVRTKRILVGDAHTLTREGIKSILSKQCGLEIISEALNSAELLEKIQHNKPDLIIIDFHIPGHFRIEDIELIRRNFPEICILVISTNQLKQDILRVLDADVSGYLLKECDEEEITSAVKAILRGEKFFCGRVMDSILEKSNHKCLPGEVCNHCMSISLSSREIEIVKLIADGLTTKDIASRIHLSFFTVATHRKNIFRKLQIRNSPELVLYAMKEGIIGTSSVSTLQ